MTFWRFLGSFINRHSLDNYYDFMGQRKYAKNPYFYLLPSTRKRSNYCAWEEKPDRLYYGETLSGKVVKIRVHPPHHQHILGSHEDGTFTVHQIPPVKVGHENINRLLSKDFPRTFRNELALADKIIINFHYTFF